MDTQTANTDTKIAALLVPVGNIDWEALVDQKIALLKVLSNRSIGYDEGQTDPLEGILHLIDAVQDAAAEVLGEEAVFGPEVDGEFRWSHKYADDYAGEKVS
jgi:hypothetical protein